MDAVLNIRTNKATRDQAKKIFSEMGISTSAGVNMFLSRVVTEKCLLFTPSLNPKKIREDWDREVSDAMRHRGHKSARAALKGL